MLFFSAGGGYGMWSSEEYRCSMQDSKDYKGVVKVPGDESG